MSGARLNAPRWRRAISACSRNAHGAGTSGGKGPSAEMKCRVLVSTMNGVVRADVSKLREHMIVVNQIVDHDPVPGFHNFPEGGLSRSRNRAIEIAGRESIDIGLISDNDVEFPEDVMQTVVRAFSEYPPADIITFQTLTPDGGLRKARYRSRAHWHDIRSIGRVSSIEIAFRVDSILRSGLKFDERFGLGSTFPTGEETVFLADALRRGLKILYVPVPVCIHPKASSGGGFAGNPGLIKSKGAMLYRIFEGKAYVASALFSMRHHRKAGLSATRFYSLMVSGIRDYQRQG